MNLQEQVCEMLDSFALRYKNNGGYERLLHEEADHIIAAVKADCMPQSSEEAKERAREAMIQLCRKRGWPSIEKALREGNDVHMHVAFLDALADAGLLAVARPEPKVLTEHEILKAAKRICSRVGSDWRKDILDIVQWAISESNPDYAAMEDERDRLAADNTLLLKSASYANARAWQDEAKAMEAERGRLKADLAAVKGAMDADDERLRKAALRIDIEMGCDAPEWMADKIIELRAKLADATKRADVAENRVVALRADLEEVRSSRDGYKSSCIALDAEIELRKAASTPLPMPSDEEIDAEINKALSYGPVSAAGMRKIVHHFLAKYRGMVGPTAEEAVGALLKIDAQRNIPTSDRQAELDAWWMDNVQSRESVEKPLREEIARLKAHNERLDQMRQDDKTSLGHTIHRLEQQFREKNERIAELEIPLCIGLPTIKTLIETGKAEFSNHAPLVAADDLYQNFSFFIRPESLERIAELERQLKQQDAAVREANGKLETIVSVAMAIETLEPEWPKWYAQTNGGFLCYMNEYDQPAHYYCNGFPDETCDETHWEYLPYHDIIKDPYCTLTWLPGKPQAVIDAEIGSIIDE